MGDVDNLTEGYLICSDKTMIQLTQVEAMLRKTYWAKDRPVEAIRKSIENSLVYGVYYRDKQVGFARVVTDYATIFYMCDIVIDEMHRGMGLGKKLIKTILQDEQLPNLFGILKTTDAHSLYQQYGFVKSGDLFMYKNRQ